MYDKNIKVSIEICCCCCCCCSLSIYYKSSVIVYVYYIQCRYITVSCYVLGGTVFVVQCKLQVPLVCLFFRQMSVQAFLRIASSALKSMTIYGTTQGRDPNHRRGEGTILSSIESKLKTFEIEYLFFLIFFSPFIHIYLQRVSISIIINMYMYVCIYMYIYISIINIYVHVYLNKSLAQSFIQQVSPRLQLSANINQYTLLLFTLRYYVVRVLRVSSYVLSYGIYKPISL